jgi:CRP-like cAMP-binding protein
MCDPETVALLQTVPLFQGRSDTELRELARVVRRRKLQQGATLWRQDDEAREMLVLVEGALAASLDVPGDQSVEVARIGPGETVGEIGLLDGGGHTTNLRVTEAATVLALSRLDLSALLIGRGPSAFTLRRRLASLFAGRLRAQLASFAASLGEETVDSGAGGEGARPAPAELRDSGAPDSKYIRRMAAFHEFEPVALWGFLTSGSFVTCPPDRLLLAEGEPSTAYYLTINGAVEQVLLRGRRRIRVGLAGPGKAFGYEGLIDGEPCPMTAITRERALLLVVPGDSFTQLFHGEDAVSRGFLEAIQQDLLFALRDTSRPFTRLAASV